jgi:hypothetical protein
MTNELSDVIAAKTEKEDEKEWEQLCVAAKKFKADTVAAATKCDADYSKCCNKEF